MENRNRDKWNAIEAERLISNGIQAYFRDAGIAGVVENVGKFAAQSILRFFGSKYLHGALLKVVVGAHIVQAGDVVFVAVRYQDCI